MTIEQLESALLKLAASERARLAERLIASLDAESEAQRAWYDEAERRLAKIQGGSVREVPADEVYRSVTDVTSRALSLPRAERAQLAQQLIASLDRDPEIEAAWDEEIRRRVAELEKGTAETIPSAEVFAEARRWLKV